MTVDGKQFAANGERFRFRGVTYGTFRPRAGDAALYPEETRVAEDFSRIADAGFTVVRTYTAPAPDLVEQARRRGLRLLPTAFYEDWRYMVGASRRQASAIARAARTTVRQVAQRFAGDPAVLALSLGNELPADVIRWIGARRAEEAIDSLISVARDVDPDLLLTYGSYPTAEHLRLPNLDFLTFNVYLERRSDFRRYLNRLHHLAGERPLVLGEIGRDSAGSDVGERQQAEYLAWQLETAIERGVAGTCVFSWTDEWAVGGKAVEGWHFGLTRADRSPKPALGVARAWNHRSVADLDADWPSISVVVCAYNAEATLDECLRHATALDYPRAEVIVVDDGSTDGTAAIAGRFPGVRLVTVPHGGLGAARNAGIEASRHPLVAFLDADAYPPPEWLHYLALGLDAPNVGGVGGPNVAPSDDALTAQAVFQAPGGPVHVLVHDDRAEHVPGCNMAFWKDVLVGVGSFDPVYTSAGDDVDVCWKVLDAGWEIAFHPAALVWHHRRPGVGAYLRQQRGYGRSETLVAARHPHRYTRAGSARWRGRIYLPGPIPRSRQRVYRGVFGGAAFQSVYAARSDSWDLMHQLGVPAAAATIALAPLVTVEPWMAAPVAVAVAFLVLLWSVSAVRAQPPATLRSARVRFGSTVALLNLLQPIARLWGRAGSPRRARPGRPLDSLPGPARRGPGRVLILPADRDRVDVAREIITCLADHGLRAGPPTGWEPYDARLQSSVLARTTLTTTAFPAGAIQVRVTPRPHPTRTVLAVALVAGAFAAFGPVATSLGALALMDLGYGLWRGGPVARQAITSAANRRPAADRSSPLPASPRRNGVDRVTHPASIGLNRSPARAATRADNRAQDRVLR